jgi:hypothetical protein
MTVHAELGANSPRSAFLVGKGHSELVQILSYAQFRIAQLESNARNAAVPIYNSRRKAHRDSLPRRKAAVPSLTQLVAELLPARKGQSRQANSLRAEQRG